MRYGLRMAQRRSFPTDRSDGGLPDHGGNGFTGHCGVEADIAALGDDHLAALFNEELGR